MTQDLDNPPPRRPHDGPQRTPGPAGGAPGTPHLIRGEAVGRYLVLGEVGRGGMGAVYAGYDPELDRKVALKLLHAGAGQARLLREAHALARLAHPNVLTVFDAGQAGDRIFLAAEYVEGVTVGRWLAAAARPWRRVLEVFIQAGRGLAAAHEAGLVHRDFKPSNVLLGDDGRVLVVDFGLVQAVAEAAGDGEVVALEELEEGLIGPPESPLDSPATRTGAAVGTPAYMAPEQRAGKAAGPAADQYSFCVALHQALFGEVPGPARVPGEGSTSSVTAVPLREEAPPEAEGPTEPAGDVEREATLTRPAAPGSSGGGRSPESAPSLPRHPLRRHRAPARLRRVLARGLDPEPGERYPSMAGLLRRLEREPGRRRRRALAAAVLTAVLAAGLLAYQQGSDEATRVCRGGKAKLAGIWSAGRRRSVEASLREAGRPYGADAWRSVEAAVGRYTRAWTAMYTEACAATHFRGEQSPELLDLRMDCLEQRRQELDALLGLLEEPDPALPERAVEAVSSLTPVSRCADVQALLAPIRLPDDPAQRQRVAKLRRRLAEVKAHEDTGRYHRGRELARQVVDEARDTGHPPLTAEALLALGRLQEREGDPEAAEATLVRSVLAAEAGGHDRVSAEAFIRLVRVVGYQRERHSEGRDYAANAAAVLARLSRPEELSAVLADHVGTLHFRQAEYDEALARHRESLDLKRRLLPPDHPEIADSLVRIANVLSERGELKAARERTEEALALYEAALGPSHPKVAVGLNNLALLLSRLGEHQEALDASLRALEIRRRALDPESPLIAGSLLQTGTSLQALGRQPEARESYEEATRIYEAALGPVHPRTAVALSAVASTLLATGEPTAALEHYRRALAIEEEAYGRDHPWVAKTLYNLGVAEKDLGQHRAAAGRFRQALATWEASYGADHPLVAHALTGLGQALLGQGQPVAAVAPLERAVVIREHRGESEELLASSRFALARALAAAGQDAERARHLAEEAGQTYRKAPLKNRKELTEIETWLAARGEPGGTGGQ